MKPNKLFPMLLFMALGAIAVNFVVDFYHVKPSGSLCDYAEYLCRQKCEERRRSDLQQVAFEERLNEMQHSLRTAICMQQEPADRDECLARENQRYNNTNSNLRLRRAIIGFRATICRENCKNENCIEPDFSPEVPHLDLDDVMCPGGNKLDCPPESVDELCQQVIDCPCLSGLCEGTVWTFTDSGMLDKIVLIAGTWGEMGKELSTSIRKGNDLEIVIPADIKVEPGQQLFFKTEPRGNVQKPLQIPYSVKSL